MGFYLNYILEGVKVTGPAHFFLRHHGSVCFYMAPEILTHIFVGGSFTVETQVDGLAGIRSWGSISGCGMTLTLKQKKLVMVFYQRKKKGLTIYFLCCHLPDSRVRKQQVIVNSYGTV